MARAKAGEAVDLKGLDVIDLGSDLGLTLLTDVNKANVDNFIPTGIPQYDRILGGGIPLGRLTEIFGFEASGKSTWSSQIAKIATQLGVIVIFIDVEGTADTHRLESLGVDVSKIFTIQPGTGRLKNKPTLTVETVGEELEYWIDTFNTKAPGLPILIIWDSLANTMSNYELDADFEGKKIGAKATSVTKLVNKVTPLLTNTNTGLIIINQGRDDLDAGMYGDKIKSTGGRALEHACSLKILVKKASQIKRLNSLTGKDEYYGHIMRINTKKSKISRPNQKAEASILSEYPLTPGGDVILTGFDAEYNIYQEAVEDGLITKGQWRNYTKLDGTEVKLRDAEWVPRLKEDRELFEELFVRTYLYNFPKGFAPLKNTKVDLTAIPEFGKLKDAYENKKKESEAKGEQSSEGEVKSDEQLD